MQKAKLVDPTSDVKESITAKIDSHLFYVGSLVILGGLGFLAYKHLNKQSPLRWLEIQMSLVKTRATPPPPPNFEME